MALQKALIDFLIDFFDMNNVGMVDLNIYNNKSFKIPKSLRVSPKYLVNKIERFFAPEIKPAMSGSIKSKEGGAKEVRKVQERKACPDAVGSAGVQPRKASLALPYCDIKNSQHECCKVIRRLKKGIKVKNRR